MSYNWSHSRSSEFKIKLNIKNKIPSLKYDNMILLLDIKYLCINVTGCAYIYSNISNYKYCISLLKKKKNKLDNVLKIKLFIMVNKVIISLIIIHKKN